MKNRNIIITTIILALGSFALPQRTQAVVPAPDGGYPGLNTAEGQSALLSLTTGEGNTAVGWFSLRSLTAGSFNTATGAGTLALNNANENTATGAGALLSNTIGVNNSANGAFALFGNTEGSYNTAVGDRALFSNTTGIVNTAIGAGALASNTTGDHNTAIGGDFVLFANTIGSFNTAIGVDALASNTMGGINTANGAFALNSNTTGNGNTAIGDHALFSNTTAIRNTAIGASALQDNITGTDNTAVGLEALLSNNEGSENTAIGANALIISTGTVNTAIGAGALAHNTTGGGNTVLGAFAGSGITTANNVICIGAAGNDVDNSCYIGQIFGATSVNGVAVLVNSNGRLGTMTSSLRFKENIKPMDKTSEALFALRPVTFRYKKEIDSAGTPEFGLVAEDVEKVNPDLIVRDKEGKPYSVRYDQVNAMLLNEFLKEHRKMEKLQNDLKYSRATAKGNTGANCELKEQAAQIQKVSAQVQTNKAAPQMADESIKIGRPTTDDTDYTDIQTEGCPRNTPNHTNEKMVNVQSLCFFRVFRGQ